MSGWYSQLLTTTTSRISNLRSTLLAGDGDGDTEDDTHVCRVLRAYYTEKGRTFPGWLPPDPKAPPPQVPVYASQAAVGARYGGLQAAGAPGPGGGGKLNSLWDNGPVSQRQDPQSLRQGRGAPPPMRSGSDAASGRTNPFAGGRTSDPRGDVQARPLPSQRAGSYQASYGAAGREGGGSAPPGGAVQDRLKQRLWGGSKTASPAGGSGPFQPPAQQQAPRSPYGGGGRGGGGDDDDDRPFMAANAPWSSNEYDYGGGSGGGVARPGGLPSGPRRPGGPPGGGPRMR